MSLRLVATSAARHAGRKATLRQPSLLSGQNNGAFRLKSATAASSEATAAATAARTASATRQESVPIGKSLLAMALAIGTVSGGAAAIEYGTSSSVQEFHPNSQRYDQSTFLGRFCRMVLACDPRLLTYSKEEVRRCQTMVADYQNLIADPPEGSTNIHRTLWEAHRISSAALHPDTGEVIPRPFRMSGYVPYNGPICVAMVASTSTPALLFWSWVNQSQNALVNYYNRNASSPMSNETLIKSYAAAVGSALTVAFGLATLIQKRFEPAKAKLMLRWVAFPSAVVASSLNCYIVRSPEIDTGIPLVNEDGEDVLQGETSQEAARRGVNSTTLSRAMLQAPVYFVPPLLLGSIPVLKRVCTANPSATVPVTTYLLLVSFGLGLPATVAIFPQISQIKADDVEEKFQHLRNSKTGRPYEVFYYNKGL